MTRSSFQEPIWWIRLSTWARLYVCGEPYYLLPKWQAGMSWWIAGVIADTVRSIRAERG